MFEFITRSWDLTKVTFSVIKADKEMLILPVLAGILSTIFFVLMAVPFIFTAIVEEFFGVLALPLYLLVAFTLYFGLSFITTFFNVGVVYIAKRRFEGGDATLGEAIGFCFSKVILIAMWAAVSATVGMILRGIERLGRRLGPIGSIITGIVTSILGMVWAIITIFVVPSMVFNNTGPFAAIKQSVDVLKKTWGEKLVQHYGLGTVQFLVMFGWFAICGVIGIISIVIFPPLVIGVLLVFFGVLMIISVVFGAANTVFNTALFWYATTGQAPSAFPQEVMQNAFSPQKKGGLFQKRDSGPPPAPQAKIGGPRFPPGSPAARMFQPPKP